MSETADSPQAVVGPYLQVYEDRDMETSRSVLADEIESEGTAFTRDGWVGAIETDWNALPDGAPEVHRYTVDGDTVAMRTTFSGTFEESYSDCHRSVNRSP